MRIVVLLLVIANLTFFAYTRLDNASRGESARLKQQIQPDKIKLLTPPQVAALGPAKMAALADVCIEWGPFSEAERAKAMTDLEPLQLGRLLSQRRVDVPPRGALLLAGPSLRPSGCVALRPLPDGDSLIGEVKRLYVRPDLRGSGLGRALVLQALAEASAIGYRELKLDTLPTMAAARA